MASSKSLLKEFQEFIMRGNVLDLAVAVIIGAAFNAVVQSLVKNVIMPIIGIIGGKPSFDDYYFTINHSQIKYGTFITDLVNFLIIAASVFLVIRTFQALQDRRRRSGRPEDAPAATDEAIILGEIRDLLTNQNGGPATQPTSAV